MFSIFNPSYPRTCDHSNLTEPELLDVLGDVYPREIEDYQFEEDLLNEYLACGVHLYDTRDVPNSDVMEEMGVVLKELVEKLQSTDALDNGESELNDTERLAVMPLEQFQQGAGEKAEVDERSTDDDVDSDGESGTSEHSYKFASPNASKRNTQDTALTRPSTRASSIAEKFDTSPATSGDATEVDNADPDVPYDGTAASAIIEVEVTTEIAVEVVPQAPLLVQRPRPVIRHLHLEPYDPNAAPPVWNWPQSRKTKAKRALRRAADIRGAINRLKTPEDVIKSPYVLCDETKPEITQVFNWSAFIPSVPVFGRGGDTSECVACFDRFPSKESHKLACKHTYCSGCLNGMIMAACTEEATMPPKCCTVKVAPRVIKKVLSRTDQIVFTRKVIEYATPHEKRVFCPNAACEKFIPYSSKQDPLVATCGLCQTTACRICRKKAHPIGVDCPEDWELEALLAIGDTNGWRRCYRCRALVELTDGCTHMTCRCGGEFCYLCGHQWDAGCPFGCAVEDQFMRQFQQEEAQAAEAQAAEDARVQAEVEEIAQFEAEMANRFRIRREAIARWTDDPQAQKLREVITKEGLLFVNHVQFVQAKLRERQYEERMDLLFAQDEAKQRFAERCEEGQSSSAAPEEDPHEWHLMQVDKQHTKHTVEEELVDRALAKQRAAMLKRQQDAVTELKERREGMTGLEYITDIE